MPAAYAINSIPTHPPPGYSSLERQGQSIYHPPRGRDTSAHRARPRAHTHIHTYRDAVARPCSARHGEKNTDTRVRSAPRITVRATRFVKYLLATRRRTQSTVFRVRRTRRRLTRLFVGELHRKIVPMRRDRRPPPVEINRATIRVTRALRDSRSVRTVCSNADPESAKLSQRLALPFLYCFFLPFAVNNRPREKNPSPLRRTRKETSLSETKCQIIAPFECGHFALSYSAIMPRMYNYIVLGT